MMHRNYKIAALVLAGTALAAAGCSTGGSNGMTGTQGKGAVTIAMHSSTAAPSIQIARSTLTRTTPGSGSIAGTQDSGSTTSTLQTADLTIAAVRAHVVGGDWIDVSGSFPLTVDVLTLVNGKTLTLPKDLIPVGSYDGLQVTISAAHLVLSDGTVIDITPPGTGWVAMIPVTFTVVEGQDTVISVRFESELSFKLVNGTLELEPEFEVESVEHEND